MMLQITTQLVALLSLSSIATANFDYKCDGHNLTWELIEYNLNKLAEPSSCLEKKRTTEFFCGEKKNCFTAPIYLGRSIFGRGSKSPYHMIVDDDNKLFHVAMFYDNKFVLCTQ